MIRTTSPRSDRSDVSPSDAIGPVDRARRPDRTAYAGWMVLTPASDHPYKVVMTYATGADSEHPAGSMLLGEAFIRTMLPPAPPRDMLRDHLSQADYGPSSDGVGDPPV